MTSNASAKDVKTELERKVQMLSHIKQNEKERETLWLHPNDLLLQVKPDINK